VNGEWINATDARTFNVLDPSNGKILKSVADASVVDGLNALDAAVRAAEKWAATGPRERAEILRKVFDSVISKQEEFALLMTLEMGKPLEEAREEVKYGAEFLRWFSEEAVR